MSKVNPRKMVSAIGSFENETETPKSASKLQKIVYWYAKNRAKIEAVRSILSLIPFMGKHRKAIDTVLNELDEILM